MAVDRNNRFGGRPTVVLSALVVAIVVGVGAAIADHGGAAESPGATAAGSTTPTAVPIVARPASVAPVQRLVGEASTFDSSSGGWTGQSATLSRATTAASGAGSLQIDGSDPVGGSMTVWSPREEATGGDRYVATASVRAVTAVRGAQSEIRFIDAAGTVTDTETGQLLTDSLGGWLRLPGAVGISPKGTTQIQLGITFPVVGAGAVHLVDDAMIAQTPGGSTNVVGPLHAAGTQILEGDGTPLMMRGLQRFGLEGGTKTPMPTESEIAQLKLWGANEVRISLGEQKWLTTSCHYQRNYPQVVDQVVHWVTSRGMVALLNLHFSSIGPCGTPGLTPMADSPGSVTFWQEVATRYKDNPLVAFDLFNEPHVPQSVWLDGGTFTADGQTVQAAGMQRLYDVVRGTGATNLIVVSGLDYADHPPTAVVQGTNIAYGAHAYQCTTGPPPGCTTPNPFDAAVPLHHWVAFGQTHPVIVTEFGYPAGDSSAYNSSVIRYAEAHHWGWSGFAWDGGTGGLYDLIQADTASDGVREPNPAGMPLLAGFARNTLARPAH